MGTRRAFVFTNFIFVQNLLVLLLTWNVSSTTSPPSPPLSLALLFPSRQQHPVGRTLYASRPSRGSKTGEEAILASTQTPVEERRQNNFPPNVSPFPLSSSAILLADKTPRSDVKQLYKDKSNEGTDSPSYSRSALRTNYITPLHMTVNLKGSLIPLIPTFGALSSVARKKSIESSSSSPSSSSERFFRLSTYHIQSLLPPPPTSTTPTSLSNSASFIFSTSKQNLKPPSFTASNSSSFSSKKYRHRQISPGRKKIDKRSKKLISTQEKHRENLSVITPVTDINGPYYINHPLNYVSQEDSRTKGKLYQEKVGRKKRISDKKQPETQSQRYVRANARTSLLNDDSKRLFVYVKHIKASSDRQTNDQNLLHKKLFPNSIIQSLQLKRDFSFENKTRMPKSRNKKIKVEVKHLLVENTSQIQNFSILKRFVSPIRSLPVMTVEKQRELLAAVPPVPSSFPTLSSSSSSSSSILLRSLLKQKTTPDDSSILRPEIHVDNANHKTKQKVQHTNSNGTIPSMTDLIAQQNENTSDVETEVNDIISGNSKGKSEFMLYQKPKNRQKQVASQHEPEYINHTDIFITTSVYSSTLPTRSGSAIGNITTASPLKEINKLFLKANGNISLPRSKSKKHDDISNRHRRNIDENKKYLHKLTNSENKLKKRQQKYKQYRNRSEERYQVMRKENMNSSPPFGNQISVSADPYKNDSKLIKVRKKRSFLSDYEHYIEQEERKEITEMENKEKLLAKSELFNDVSLDEVFAVQSQPKSHSKVKSHQKDNYEGIDFSLRDSKISLSTLQFPPAEPILLPPVILTPEKPKTLQVFKIASGDTRESPVQRNQPEFGSGDELALSFLVPCTKREKYYCLNGGTCLIVYTMDVKTCRCPIGYSGQRCEQIDHDSYYSLLGDPAYSNESG